MAKDYQSEIAHNWQSKEHKNNKKTPKNGSHIGLQSVECFTDSLSVFCL